MSEMSVMFLWLFASGGAAVTSPTPGAYHHLACCRVAACSSFSHLFLHATDASTWHVAHAESLPPTHCENCASTTWHCAQPRALTVYSDYAIVKPCGVTSNHPLWNHTRWVRAQRTSHCIINNMHQGYLDCNGVDGTSR